MKFAVVVNGKKFPVIVMREPNNISALSNFSYEGRTYKGIPSQFNGLRFDKLKERYTATSIAVTEQKPITEDIIINNNQEINETVTANIIEPPIEEDTENDNDNLIEKIASVDTCSIIEQDNEENLGLNLVFTEEVEPEEITEEEIEEEESSERKREFLELLAFESSKLNRKTQEELSKITIIKKITFQPRWSSLFPESETYGEGLFEKHKHVWIKLHGSEHLKTAHEMQCRCDGLYIQERASVEFTNWTIHDLLVYYEIDSPDYGILTYLKNFKNMHRDLLNMYHSRIILVTTDDNPDEDNALVVITDYLGHCDLSIPFVNLVELYGDRC